MDRLGKKLARYFSINVLCIICSLYAGACNAAGWSTADSLATGRLFHTATLLLDGRVLVAGGYTADPGYLASAELYDPSTDTWSPADSLATARGYHSATLLPDGRVLVAGGRDAAGFHASAELYDPSTDTWSAAEPLTAARGYHSATLLPDGRVLVAGGNGTTGPPASAELYDPSTNTWSAAGSLATVRSYPCATLLPDGRVLVAGGYGAAGYLASVELYDPSANSWSAAASLATGRYTHSATLLPDGRVLVAGGYGNGYLASAELYDPATDTWSAAGALSNGRMYHSATLLPDGHVLVAGGEGLSLDPSSTELYDPTTNSWSTAIPMASARRSHSATLLSDGRVLVAGGVIGTSPFSAELYDPAENYWSAANSLATARSGHSATLLSDGRVLVVAGSGGSLSSAELYDPSTDTWSPAASLANVRTGYFSTTLLQDGRVLVAGGLANAFLSAELYNPSIDTWSPAKNLTTGRFGHSGTLLSDGMVLVAGGRNAALAYISSAELYNPATNTWTVVASMPNTHYVHTATLLPDGRVLAAGGYNNGGFVSAVELYDPPTRFWSAAAPLATGRSGHSATLLPDGRVLVAGGYNGATLSSAELYDPSANTWSAAAPLATARSGHSATLLPDGRVLVTGGNGAAGYLSSAELYDPSTDTWAPAASLATNRDKHSATLLPDRRVLVAGGYNGAILSSAELYDKGLGFNNDWRPTIATVSSPVTQLAPFSITGTGFRGVGNTEASSGGYNNSATNYPLVQIRSATNEQTQWLVPQNFSATSYTGDLAGDFPDGPAWITIFVNGIPSIAKYVYVGNSFLVTAIAGEGGSLDATTPSPQMVDMGATVDFTFNADPGYHVSSISGCGISYSNTDTSVTTYTATTAAITSDCVVTASFALTCFADSDHDGFGSTSTIPDNGNGVCEAADGESTVSTDCNDGDAGVHPGSTEIVADGVDQDCDGGELCYRDLDDDGYRPDGTSTVSSANLGCTDPTEAISSDPTGDCNDGDPAVHPGATEIVADGVDQDCDGGELCYADLDDDSYRPDDGSSTIPSEDLDCEDATEAVSSDLTGDCNDANATINPGAGEGVGDEIDQDCDGGELCYADLDDDGYRPDGTSTVLSADADCADTTEATSGEPPGDCNDGDPAVHPGATEIVADGTDQNCNGSDLCYLDADGDTYGTTATVADNGDFVCDAIGESAVNTDCNDADAGVYPEAKELCDSVDNNCNNYTDEYGACSDGFWLLVLPTIILNAQQTNLLDKE